MPEHAFVESEPQWLELDLDEAELLRRMGRQMASLRTWWNDDESAVERSVIKVDAGGGRRYRVTFMNVVGVVQLPGRHIEVRPKIPWSHFHYLIQKSDIAPRIGSTDVRLETGGHLLEVLACWFLAAAESLLRIGLRQDYRLFADEQTAIRGQVLACDTALELLKGRAVAMCEFEELTEDAPLNRILRAGAERLARVTDVSVRSRARARQVAFRLQHVGALCSNDLRVQVDRVSRAYARVVPLALLILRGCGLSTAMGHHTGRAFLVSTPELIEDGLRAVVAEAVAGVDVVKKRLLLGSTGLSMNPDLVFGEHIAVGDVKYRNLSALWDRGHLYQAVAFATAFRAAHALVLGFSKTQDSRLPLPTPVGGVTVTPLAWIAHDEEAPDRSAQRLRAQLSAWATPFLRHVVGSVA